MYLRDVKLLYLSNFFYPMKKLFCIMMIASCFMVFNCKKTCSCKETVTTTYSEEWMEIWGTKIENPTVSTATGTKEAKKCSDLNAEATSITASATIHDVVVCE
jgi:hypothetical protein